MRMIETLKFIDKIIATCPLLTPSEVFVLLAKINDVELSKPYKDIHLMLGAQGYIENNKVSKLITDLFDSVKDGTAKIPERKTEVKETPLEKGKRSKKVTTQTTKPSTDDVPSKELENTEDDSQDPYVLYYNTLQNALCSFDGPDYEAYKKATKSANDSRGLPPETIAKGLYTFLSIMPTKSPTKNAAWEEVFGVSYKGVTLRVRSASTTKHFIKLIDKDGIPKVCIALFKFVQDAVDVKQGKAFVKKIGSFFEEWDTWKITAEESVTEAINSGDLEELDEEEVEEVVGRSVI